MNIIEKIAGKPRRDFRIPDEMVASAFVSELEAIRLRKYSEYNNTGGRGSGKSTFIALAGIEVLENNKNLHWLVCRNVKDTLKDSVYAQIRWAIEVLGLGDEYIFKTSPLEIIKKSTRQKIYFRGADDPMKIKSIKPPFGYIGIVWFEELDQFGGDSVVRSIEQSALRGGDISYNFKSFNPPKSNINWANKYVKLPKASRLVVHNTYKDVPREWLGSAFIDEAEFLQETNPAAYEHEYLGIANGTGGAVFDNLILREVTGEEIKHFDRIYRGIDWGWYPDPARYVAMSYFPNFRRLIIYGEVHAQKTSNEDFSKLLLSYGVKRSDDITADSSEKKSIGDFRSWGFRVRPAEKGPHSVDEGMKWLCSLREIIIDPKRCPYTAKEFSGYEYERDRNGDVISGYPDRDNHSIDAVRYAMERVWKRKGN